ncbi:MAG: UDPGP type 1 family protein [Pirellulaceae bacterium]
MSSIEEKLKIAQQEHLLRFLDRLAPDQRTRLRSQIEEIDFEQLRRLVSGEDATVNWAELAMRAEPRRQLDSMTHPEFSLTDAIARGEAALRAGEVGMILVAGGQGTRLGFDSPKGLFPIGPISGRTLLQMHCDRLLAMSHRYAVAIPMYVMTSPATDTETRAYFDQHERCGLAEEQLRVFCQGTMPAVDDQGRVLMASRESLALSPDGHGGLVAALGKHGCLNEARQRGIQYFYYAQVDNPLAELCDPALIGYHILANSQMTTQVVKKRFATEKVGNVVSIDGKVQIIEYSDLPDAAAQQTTPEGALKLWAGNIAVHILDRDFLEKVVDSAEGLPFHRAHKRVAFVDENGETTDPKEPNAIKFERFIFDLLPLAERAYVVEGNAAQVFAPVKNANGADVDTPAHSQRALCDLHRRWLEAAGATLAENVRVEIHPAWALDADEVRAKLTSISPDQLRFEADTLLR